MACAKECKMQTMAAIAAMYIKCTSLLFWTNIKGLEHGSVTSPVGWGLSLGTSPDLWGNGVSNVIIL